MLIICGVRHILEVPLSPGSEAVQFQVQIVKRSSASVKAPSLNRRQPLAQLDDHVMRSEVTGLPARRGALEADESGFYPSGLH